MPHTVTLDSRLSLHVARQPIIDRDRQVHAYELLYRGHRLDRTCNAPADLAAARVVTDALLAIGLDTLTGGAPAFINFTRRLLIDGAAALLPPEAVVIELLETISVDDQVFAACEDLKAQGYTLALDDFVAGSDAEALLPFADYVKLDVLDPAPDVWQPVARRLRAASKRVVAERVETPEIADLAAAAGCTLFQGFYFCRPSTYDAAALPAGQLTYLNLFAAVNRPDLTIADLETLVKRDVSLTLRVLRSVNSSAFGIAREITSVRHALVMMGVAQVRRWTSIWALAGLNGGRISEVMAMALLRARTCEIVGEAWAGPDAAGELFLLGLCSMLDAILDRPLEQAVAALPLAPAVRDALLGVRSPMRTVLDAVEAHERGNWDAAIAAAATLGLAGSIVPAAYTRSLTWARDVAACAEQAA